MFISPSGLIGIALLAAGLYWCYVIIKRLPEDIQEFREADDNYRRIAIVVIWLLTVLITLGVLFFAVPIIVVIAKSVIDLISSA
jgi:hypothetical protein